MVIAAFLFPQYLRVPAFQFRQCSTGDLGSRFHHGEFPKWTTRQWHPFVQTSEVSQSPQAYDQKGALGLPRSTHRLSKVESFQALQFDKKPNAPAVWPAVLTSAMHSVSGQLRHGVTQ